MSSDLEMKKRSRSKGFKRHFTRPQNIEHAQDWAAIQQKLLSLLRSSSQSNKCGPVEWTDFEQTISRQDGHLLRIGKAAQDTMAKRSDGATSPKRPLPCEMTADNPTRKLELHTRNTTVCYQARLVDAHTSP